MIYHIFELADKMFYVTNEPGYFREMNNQVCTVTKGNIVHISRVKDGGGFNCSPTKRISARILTQEQYPEYFLWHLKLEIYTN